MSRDKNKKKESFFTKFVNLVLTVVLAFLIGSQVCTAANNNLRIAQISDAHFSSFEENTSYKLLPISKILKAKNPCLNKLPTGTFFITGFILLI